MKTPNLLSLLSFVAIFIFTACEKQEMDGFSSIKEADSQPKATYSLNNWMGALSDNIKLSEISIPGSHEAGALYESWPGTAICQELTIDNQLNAGIRFLDIRCRHIGNSFVIHHGSVYQHLNFDDVLGYCWDFLDGNPSECIIMSIKEEYDESDNTNTFQETFDSYVDKNPDGWYLGSTVPALGDVRGKIILFRRFSYSTSLGLAATPGWEDNTTFYIYHYTTFRVQDNYYVTNTDDKWDAITSLFSEAKNGSSTTLYVNFTSGYKPLIFGIPSITSVSDVINPQVTDYFTANTSGRFGIIPMDFNNEERCALIIETNF